MTNATRPVHPRHRTAVRRLASYDNAAETEEYWGREGVLLLNICFNFSFMNIGGFLLRLIGCLK